MTITAPGIYSGIPIDAYIADRLCAVPTLSSGCANRIESISPLHGWIDHPRLNPDHAHDVAKKADIGSVAHDVLLEGGTDRIEIIDPEDYPAKNGNIPDGWTNVSIRAARDVARAEGRYPILKADYAAVDAMVTEAREFLERSDLRGILACAESEATMIWQEGPVWLRARPDLLAHDRSALVHYKTSKSKVHPDAFARVIDSQSYDFTLMFYARGLAELEPDRTAYTRHIIVAQEQEAPFSCALFDLTPSKASIASGKVDRAIKTWAKCMASNRWPAYDTRVHSIEAKPWQLEAEEMKTFYGLGELDPLQADGVQA